MNDEFKNVDTEELKSRMIEVLTNLDNLCKEIGPKVEEIGRLRLESDTLYETLIERGVIVKESNVESNTDKTKVNTA
jgi:regulator of replication initiation timing